MICSGVAAHEGAAAAENRDTCAVSWLRASRRPWPSARSWQMSTSVLAVLGVLAAHVPATQTRGRLQTPAPQQAAPETPHGDELHPDARGPQPRNPRPRDSYGSSCRHSYYCGHLTHNLLIDRPISAANHSAQCATKLDMSNHAKIGSLSARIGEVSRAIEKLQGELTDLGHQLQRAISEDQYSERSTHLVPRGAQPLVRRAGVIVSPPSATSHTHSLDHPPRRPRPCRHDSRPGREGPGRDSRSPVQAEGAGRKTQPQRDPGPQPRHHPAAAA